MSVYCKLFFVLGFSKAVVNPWQNILLKRHGVYEKFQGIARWLLKDFNIFLRARYSHSLACRHYIILLAINLFISYMFSLVLSFF